MGKRYGRNQKRAHREREASLEAMLKSSVNSVSQLSIEAERLKIQVRNARGDALAIYVQGHPLIQAIVADQCAKMYDRLGPELAGVARQIAGTDRRRSRQDLSPEFRGMADTRLSDGIVTRLRGTIPAIQWEYLIADIDLRNVRFG